MQTTRNWQDHPGGNWCFWNRPLGDGCVWGASTDADTKALCNGGYINPPSGNGSVKYISYSTSDPVATFVTNFTLLAEDGTTSVNPTFHIHCPIGTTAAGPLPMIADNQLGLVDVNSYPGKYFLVWPMDIQNFSQSATFTLQQGNYSGTHLICENVTLDIYATQQEMNIPPNTDVFTTHYNQTAGIITGYDIDPSRNPARIPGTSLPRIQHVLRYAHDPKYMKAAGTGQGGETMPPSAWPAAYEDWQDPNQPGNLYIGDLLYGTHVGIPKGTTMPPGLSSAGQMIWDALVCYGASIKDVAGGGFHLWCDQDAAGGYQGGGQWYQSANADLPTIVKYLRPLRNQHKKGDNFADSPINGPGVRLDSGPLPLAIPSGFPTPSANYTTATPGSGSFTDTFGYVWTVTSGNQVAVNGTADTNTANVTKAAYVDGIIWHKNSAGSWYSKTAPWNAWSTGSTTDPIATSQANAYPGTVPPPTPTPTPTANISRVVAPLTGTVTKGTWVTNQSISVGAMPHGYMRYNYLLPQGYDANSNIVWPILFYGHQNDEGMSGGTYPSDGSSLVNQTVIDGTFNTVAFRTNYPCIVVVPHCDQSIDTSGVNGNSNFGGYGDGANTGGNEQAINALLQWFIANFRVDTTRCYCTGDSLGAIGTLAWLVDNNAYGTGTSNKFWAAGMGFSDQLYRPNLDNSTVFPKMANVPYIAVSTNGDNNAEIYDKAGWRYFAGNSNYPTPSTFSGGGISAIRAGSASYWYIDIEDGTMPWSVYRQLNADGGSGTPLYDLLFSINTNSQPGVPPPTSTPTPPPSATPVSGVYIVPGSGSFTDAAGNVYTISADGVATENGTAIPGGGGTDAGEYYNGQVYFRDKASQTWYIWNGSNFSQASTAPPPPTSTPLPSSTPIPVSRLLPAGFLSTSGSQVVDQYGNPVRIAAVNWIGGDSNGNAPLGLTSAPLANMMSAIASLGFNTIRLAYNDKGFFSSGSTYIGSNTANPTLASQTPLQLMDTMVSAAATAGLKVIIAHYDNEGSTTAGARQANGLWFDSGLGSNNTDGAGKTGTVTTDTFKSNWVTMAQRYAGNPTVIGFDLHHEPSVPASASYGTAITWGDGAVNDIRAMYVAVGNAILSVNPDALIICAGPLQPSTLFLGTGNAPEGDLSKAATYPVSLTKTGKLLYTVHEFPSQISNYSPDSGSTAVTRMNAAWGFMVANQTTPVLVGAGASLDGAAESAASGALAAEQAWASTLVGYLNGSATGGPTFTGSQQGVSSVWMHWGDLGTQAPDGVLTGGWAGAPKAGQKNVYSQLLYGASIPAQQRPIAPVATVGTVSTVSIQLSWTSSQPSYTGISPDETVVLSGSKDTITDLAGNIWSINASAQVVVNGTVDANTGGVAEIAWVNGKIWQENTSGTWWSKTAPTDTWAGGTSTSPLVGPLLYQPQYRRSGSTTWSNFGSPIQGLSALVTGLASGVSYDLQVVATSGAGSATSAIVTATTSSTGGGATPPSKPTNVQVAMQPTSASVTWTPSTGSAPITYQVSYRQHPGSTPIPPTPTPSISPTPPPTTPPPTTAPPPTVTPTPTPAASGAIFITPGSGSFTDSNRNVYTLSSNGSAMENGQAMPNGGGTSKMAYYNGQVYAQDAASGSWYTWDGNSNWNGPVTAPPSGGTTTTPAPGNLKIMPLGDSMTAGGGTAVNGGPPPGAYRAPLYTGLVNAGYTFTFVGDRTENPGPLPIGQQNHEGIGGYAIDLPAGSTNSPSPSMLQYLKDHNILSTYTPDVVLLMMGYNNMYVGAPANVGPATAYTYLKNMINYIFATLPNAKVIVATEPAVTGDSGVPTSNPSGTELGYFNYLILNSLTTDITNTNLSVVDVNGAENGASGGPAQFIGPDGVHPNVAGSQKIADTFMAGIQKVYQQSSGGTITPASVIAYLKSISGTKTISGQWIERGTDSTYGFAAVQRIAQNYGYWPGMIGGDYWWANAPLSYGADYSFNTYAKQYWQAGGLVNLNLGWPNPASGGGAQDGVAVNFDDLVTPGNQTYNNFITLLDQVATGLLDLQSSGVVVLFRPFHEMNGNWTWWGTQNCSAAQFITMWKFVHDYYTKTKGLKNLVWVYATNAGFDQLSRFPGTAYVDMTGFDLYTSSPSDTSDYNTLLSTGLPVAMCEFGPGSPSSFDSSFDETTLVNTIASDMPKITYWMQWWTGWDMNSVQNTKAALANPRVINRGSISLFTN